MYDNKPGISFEDKLNFAKKIGTPSYLVEEYSILDLTPYYPFDLEQILNKYKNGNTCFE